MNLSRLNHWLPGCEAPPEVLQGPAQFPHQIADSLLPQAGPVCHATTALAPAVDVLEPQPTLGQRLVRPLLLAGALRAAGCRRGHAARPLRERAGQAAARRHARAPGRPGIRWRRGEAQGMPTAAVGVVQPEAGEEGLDQQAMFDRGRLCLPALTLRLGRRGLGADEAPCGPGMGPRGDAGAAAAPRSRAADASASGATTEATAVAETPRRCARAIRARAGASPRARRAPSSAGQRPCIPGWACPCPLPHRRPWPP
jgi:hypothetical protein